MESRFLVFFAAIIHVIIVSAYVTAQYIDIPDPSGCVVTDTECPCSIITPPGACMNHQGAEMCTMGPCKPSYRCDCMGYELCKTSPCALYTTDIATSPDLTTPFECHLTPAAGICTDYSHIIDTVEAVGYAAAEVSLMHGATLRLQGDSSSAVHSIEKDTAEVADALNTIDPSMAQVTGQERKEIEKQARVVTESLAEARRLQEVSAALHTKLHTISALIEGNRSVALEASSSASEAEKKLKQAQTQSAAERRSCTECPALKATIEESTRARRNAASQGGHDARGTRGEDEGIRKHDLLIRENRFRSIEAKTKLLTKVNAIVARMGTPRNDASQD